MALRLSTKRQFTREVTADVPNDKGGFDACKFKVTYTVDSARELLELPTPDALRRAVVGWDGLEAEDGSPLQFSADNLDLALADFPVSRAMSKGLLEGLSGDPSRKN